MDDEELLNDPTGGPSAGTESRPEEKGDQPLDLSAGAGGQSEDKGAVEDVRDAGEEGKPTPG